MPSRRARGAPLGWTDALVLLGYAAISFAYFGWRLLPHPGRYLVGSGRDPELFVWVFAWWPHAIGSWTNPFFSHAVYAPTGINLAWTTSVPALALAFAPLTVAFGPAVSYNVAASSCPRSARGRRSCSPLLDRSLGLARRRLPVRLLELHARPPVGGHLNLTATSWCRSSRSSSSGYVRGEIEGVGARVAARRDPRAPARDLDRDGADRDARPRARRSRSRTRSSRRRAAASVVPAADRGGLRVRGGARGAARLLRADRIRARSFGDPPFFSADLLNFVVPTQ